MASISASWTKVAESDRLRRSSQIMSVVDSRAYIFGGELVPRQPVDNQFDVVDLQSAQDRKFTESQGRRQFLTVTAELRTIPTGADAPSPRVGTASTVINGDIYIFSGRGGVAMDAIDEGFNLWRYSTSSSGWQLIKPSNDGPEPRSYHAMASDGTSTIYLHAGCPKSGRLSDLWAFDVATSRWTELPAAPAPPRGGTSIAFSGGKLYRMGGFDGKTEQGGSVDVYDPSERSWASITFEAGRDGPEARSVGALLALKIRGKETLVTLFGERDPSSLGHAGAGKMLGDTWAFNIESSTWSEVKTAGALPSPRGWFDADVQRGEADAIIVHGGLAEDNSRLGDVWRLAFA